MTPRAPSEAASTTGKVNFDTKARVKMDASAAVLRRALAATAGGSNAIADRTSGLIRGEEEYDLYYAATKAPWWPTTGTAYLEAKADDDVGSNWNRYMQISPLDLGGGICVIGVQPNSQSVVEHFIPTNLIPVNVDPVSEYRTTRRAAADGRRDALAHISKSLDAAAGAYAQDAPQDVIRWLTDFGVSQLTIARALGVTPTAVRKWSRGEAAKADHRGRLARFAATYSLLAETTGVHDPAGWLDIPISSESTLTPLDLFVGGRPDLSVLLGARLMEPQEGLDAYEPAWRQTYPIDPDYEVVMLRDGSRSAVPRKRGGAN